MRKIIAASGITIAILFLFVGIASAWHVNVSGTATCDTTTWTITNSEDTIGRFAYELHRVYPDVIVAASAEYELPAHGTATLGIPADKGLYYLNVTASWSNSDEVFRVGQADQPLVDVPGCPPVTTVAPTPVTTVAPPTTVAPTPTVAVLIPPVTVTLPPRETELAYTGSSHAIPLTILAFIFIAVGVRMELRQKRNHG
jgi:hypothetical protein